jgi:hypothetical protein
LNIVAYRKQVWRIKETFVHLNVMYVTYLLLDEIS